MKAQQNKTDALETETCKEPSVKRKKTKKPKQPRTAFNAKGILREIHSYGYSYSVSKYILHTVLLFAVVIALSLFVRLQWQYILIEGVIIMGIMPFLVIGQFRTLHTMKRFMLVTNYLDNVIPIFKQKPKILYSLKQVVDLTEGEMQACIKKAIAYIENNTEDTNVYKSALAIIEKQFENSRIVSTHKIMISIEQGNSKNYQASMINIYYDVQSWINRVYGFQGELKNQRLMKIILSLAVLAVGCYMPYAFTNNDVMAGFADTAPYHILLTIYISLFLFIISAIQIKMNGSWLVDDYRTEGQDKLIDAYKKAKATSTKMAVQEIVILSLFGAMDIYAFYIQQTMFALLLALVMGVLFINKKAAKRTKMKTIRRYIVMEYPVWLRDVALNLHGHTVVTAINMSQENCSPIMKYEIERLLAAIELDPISIAPFDNFLQEYELTDVKASMKVLFSLQNLDGETLEDQVNSLIIRNQDLLSKSEQLRNKSYLSNLGWVSFVPWVAFLIFTICMLAGIMIYTMSYLSSIVEMGG